jgi:hypothetical protein
MRGYVQVSCLLFALTTLGHLVRMLARWPLVIAGRPLPVFASLLVAVITGAMTIWALRLLSCAALAHRGIGECARRTES